MARRRLIPVALRRELVAAASHRCNYCRAPAAAGVPLVIDHIIPLAAGGSSEYANLCVACYRCNGYKGSRQVSIDPAHGNQARLFHPRVDRWQDHFAWSTDGLEVLGLSSVGRATIALLRLNDEWQIRARRLWLIAGIHPPLDG
jgi:hypothetical protein